LALVTVLQFRENVSDRQAAEAVRARIDGKYPLRLELSDAGFDFSVLSEFRDRLLIGKAEQRLIDKLLECCRRPQHSWNRPMTQRLAFGRATAKDRLAPSST